MIELEDRFFTEDTRTVTQNCIEDYIKQHPPVISGTIEEEIIDIVWHASNFTIKLKADK